MSVNENIGRQKIQHTDHNIHFPAWRKVGIYQDTPNLTQHLLTTVFRHVHIQIVRPLDLYPAPKLGSKHFRKSACLTYRQRKKILNEYKFACREGGKRVDAVGEGLLCLGLILEGEAELTEYRVRSDS